MTSKRNCCPGYDVCVRDVPETYVHFGRTLMGDRPSSFARCRQTALPKQPQQEQLFDTHPEVSLDFEIVRQAAQQRYSRPFLIIDTAIVRGKVRRFRAAMPRVRPHYAVKANPDRRVLKVLVQEGAGFEIASTAELELLLGLGVAPGEIFFSNPVKSRESIAYAAARGVEWFVVDSADELRRIHETKADAKQYLRIAAPNIGSDWPLSGKFGAGAADAREIVALAAKLGTDLAGVTFHVGSQCRNPENWRVALEKASALFEVMSKADLQEGDFVYIENAGAYTTAYASHFNGFPLPEVRVFESKR